MFDVTRISSSLQTLYISDMAFNQQTELINEWHPSRMRFIGDKLLSFSISMNLFELKPDYNSGQLTKLVNSLVSSKSFAKAFQAAKLANLAPWALSERQQGEAFEHFIGLSYNLLGDCDEFNDLMEKATALVFQVNNLEALIGANTIIHGVH